MLNGLVDQDGSRWRSYRANVRIKESELVGYLGWENREEGCKSRDRVVRKESQEQGTSVFLVDSFTS